MSFATRVFQEECAENLFAAKVSVILELVEDNLITIADASERILRYKEELNNELARIKEEWLE